MLTKEDFGKQDSAKYFDENHDEDSDNTILSVVSQIGSRDNLLPKQFNYVLKNKAGGWDKTESVSSLTLLYV